MYCDRCYDRQPCNDEGLCENCADEVALRREIDGMTEEEFVEFMASRTLANDNKPRLALATTVGDLAGFLKTLS